MSLLYTATQSTKQVKHENEVGPYFANIFSEIAALHPIL